MLQHYEICNILARMKDRAVYSFSDYKEFIANKIKSSDEQWGLISKLALIAGCQRSYLSKVLSSSIHLTADHLLSLSEYWKLSEVETDFFLLLLEREKASTAKLRERIQKKIKAIISAQENLLNRVNRPKAQLGQKELVYYSNWKYSAIHILTSIPAYQTQKAIAERLQLSREIVEEALSELKEFGLVRLVKDRWVFNSTELHVAQDSPLVSLHHNNWRQQAVLNSQKRQTSNVHFTVVQSMDLQAWQRIKEKVLQLISQETEIAGPAKEELLICFACDFFEV